MMTWSLAMRNLLRNRRRSLATLLALCIGSASILIFGGYSANIQYSMQTAYVCSGGHLQVQHRDYFLYGSGNPTAFGISDYGLIVKAIQADKFLSPLIKVVTPTLQFGGVAGNFSAGVSRTVVGTGLVAKDVNQMRQWNQFDLPLFPPRFVLDGAAEDAAVIGIGVARVLQLCQVLGVANCPGIEVDQKPGGAQMPKDIEQLAQLEGLSADRPNGLGTARIELLAGQSHGTPNVVSLSILQAEGQGFKEFDEVAVILQLARAEKLLFGNSAPKATAIMVQLERSDQMPLATGHLLRLLAKVAPTQRLAVLDFEMLNPFYVQTIRLFNMIFGFIFALIGAIVLFTVSNTMNTAVVERTVEIGTLRAVGLRRAGIRRMFVTEGFLLGFVGAAAGACLALGIAFVVNRVGLTWLPPGSSEPLPLNLRVWGETQMLLGTTSALVLVAAASAWLPAYRAARLQIVEALRHA